MNERLNRWLQVDQYSSQIQQERARFFGLSLIMLSAASSVLFAADGILQVLGIVPIPATTFWGVAGLVVVSAVAWRMVRRGWLGWAINLVVLVVFLAVVVVVWPYGMTSMTGATIPLSILLVAAIADWRVALLYTTGVVLYGLIGTWAETTGELVPVMWTAEARNAFGAMLLTGFSFLVMASMSALMSALYRATRRDEQRLAVASLVNRVSERLLPALDLRWLLDQALVWLMEAYVHTDLARLYVADGLALRLAASTDPPDEDRIARREQWKIGGMHTVGRVAETRQGILMGDAMHESTLPDDGLWSGARSRVVVPMMAGESFFGVLEMQSTRANVWTKDDLEDLYILANLIANTAEKTRRLEEAQQEAEACRQKLAQIQRQMARAGTDDANSVVQMWNAYLRDLGSGQNLLLDFENETTSRDTQWTTALESAFEQGDVVALEDDAGPVLGVPIRVGGQIVGAMEFEMGDAPSDQQMDMARQIGERLGLAADNARLFAEAQRLARREAMVNEIGARLQESSDIEMALLTAAQGLGQMLASPRVSVRIGVPPEARSDGGEA